MNNLIAYILWGVLYAICTGLGFIFSPEGAVKWVFVALSVVFFAPPAWLLWKAQGRHDRNTLKLIRNLSALSLGATVLAMVLNILSILWSEAVGNALYAVLVVVSAPMACAQYGFLSLFLWACLLLVSLRCLKGKRPHRRGRPVL